MTTHLVTRAVVVVSLVCLCAAHAAAQEPPPYMDYATFTALDVDARHDAFLQVTPENRADLMRTRLQGWRDEQAPNFSPEQVAQLEENLAFISPELYREPPDPALQAQADDLAARTRAIFPHEEDLARGLWMLGDGWSRED
jgi:hypothetical protein